MNFINCTYMENENEPYLEIYGQKYFILEKQRALLKGKTNIILGIRPEHITVSKSPLDKGFEVVNDVIEYLGNNSLVRVVFPKSDDFTLNALSKGTYYGELGATSYVYWPPEKIHLFNPNSGENLLYMPPS